MNYYITYFEIVAFIASLFAWPAIKGSSHLRLFPLLLLVIVSVEVYLTFFNFSSNHYNARIYNVQVPIQHLLYLAILYLSMQKKGYKLYIATVSVVFVIFTAITTLYFTETNRYNVLSHSVGSIFIVIGILMKFYEMLQYPTSFNFLKDPFFYILFAFLLFNVSTLPYFIMSNWLHFIQKQKGFVTVMINVMSILNFILYTTYTISFIWMRLKKVPS
jgi:hypothetical protein